MHQGVEAFSRQELVKSARERRGREKRERGRKRGREMTEKKVTRRNNKT